MPEMHITRNEFDRIAGCNERHERAWGRFYQRLKELSRDTVLVVKWWEPRSPKFHRFHFAILNAIYQSQEQFDKFDALREWLQVGAGHCQFVPGPKGKMVALPLSIDFEHLDDVEFGEHHQSVRKFALSVHATRFLWPALDDLKGYEMMQSIFDTFEL